MAAEEVRAARQRTADHCFVQEDAKRAPKLACCQSSCATSLADAGSASAVDEPDQACVNDTHVNQKPSLSNKILDSRWWLNLQPNYGFEKGLAKEQLNALEEKVENLEVGEENETCKGENFQEGVKQKTSMKEMQDEMMEIDSVGCSKQTLDFSLGSDYSWIEGEKPHPWWRTTDRNELASFLSQKSLNNVENCDLPPPRKSYLGGQSCADIGDEKINTTCFDWEAKSSVFSDQAKGSLDSGFMQRNLRHSHFICDKSSSYTSIHEGVTEKAFEGDHSKAQLMEALCHSQTRAREAEEVAKQAYAEKEHIFTQLLMQASQLLAYEQWFHLLKLETDNTSQIKNKDQQVSTKFPETLPWILSEGRKLQKRKKIVVDAKRERAGKLRRQVSTKFPETLPWILSEGRKLQKRKKIVVDAKRERAGKLRSDISTYAVAFALGLGLVGAGLLLGWSVGWMLPRL